MDAIAERTAELDAAALASINQLPGYADTGCPGTADLAALVMLSNSEPYLTRSRARYELVLQWSREPGLAETSVQFAAGFYSVTHDVVAGWHGADTEIDACVIEEQAAMLLTLINGVMMSFVLGAPVVSDAAQLDRWIQTMLSGSRHVGP